MSTKSGADESQSGRIQGMQWFIRPLRVPPNVDNNNRKYFYN